MLPKVKSFHCLIHEKEPRGHSAQGLKLDSNEAQFVIIEFEVMQWAGGLLQVFLNYFLTEIHGIVAVAL